jgi:hypothetical protein
MRQGAALIVRRGVLGKTSGSALAAAMAAASSLTIFRGNTGGSHIVQRRQPSQRFIYGIYRFIESRKS